MGMKNKYWQTRKVNVAQLWRTVENQPNILKTVK
jgi:hypothetical protein